MMIKVENLLNLVTKVSTAVGDNDLIKLSFLLSNGHNLCQLVAYDGSSLQFQSRFAYEGEAEKDGAYIVKASSLIKTLALYRELGVESITIEPNESSIVLKDGKGNITLPVLDKMVTLSEQNLNEDLKGMFATPLKALQDTLKVSGIAIAKEKQPALNGVYFALDSEAKTYTVLASDGFIGTRNIITVDVKLQEGMSAEGMTFLAMPSIVKAIASLKGDAVSGIVTGKYLLLKDAENTLAVVALNRTAFPADLMNRTFSKRDESGEVVVYSRVTLPVSTFIAATELCTLSATDKEKIVKLDFSDDKFRIRESADKSARSIEAVVKVEDPTCLSKRYLVDIVRRALRAVSTDKVTVKFTNGIDLLYADGASFPVAFMAPRKD